MQQFFSLIDRKVAIVNLDPANDPPTYTAAIDIRDLVSLDSVQDQLNLGPNGGLIYCIEYLEANIDWLKEQLDTVTATDDVAYFLFDCPGQVELFTLHPGMKRIIVTMTNTWNYRIAAVQLIDAFLCSSPASYMAALLLALSTTLHLELPQVNALSKFDLANQYGTLAFKPEYYLRAQGLEAVAQAVASSSGFPPRFAKMTRDLCEVVEDFGLVGFTPLAIEDKESVATMVALVDKANGYAFAGLAASGTGKGALPPEFEYGAGMMGDPEDLWARMAERYGIKSTDSGTDSGDEEGETNDEHKQEEEEEEEKKSEDVSSQSTTDSTPL